MMSLAVPYLQESELDRSVAALLHRYAQWRNEEIAPPINIDEIVEGLLELTLEVDDLADRLGMPDVLGATWFEDRRICIDRSLEGKEGRFSFTLAHEIGHWELHRPIYKMGTLMLDLFPPCGDASPRPAVVCRLRDGRTPAEWQADQFAARLLMPAAAVRSTVRGVFGDCRQAVEGLAAHRRARLLPPELRSCADVVIAAGKFDNVSNEAMCYRLLDLDLVEDTEVAKYRLL